MRQMQLIGISQEKVSDADNSPVQARLANPKQLARGRRSSRDRRNYRFRWVGNVGYYLDEESSLYYIRARIYQPTIARWTSVDPLFYMLAKKGRIGVGSQGAVRSKNAGCWLYTAMMNNPVARVDPNGNLSIRAGETSCPGCGKAGVYWLFDVEDAFEEWFLVQKVCTVLHVAQCKPGTDGCCEPIEPGVPCQSCIFEKLELPDERGHDLWRLPWEIPGGKCGTMGVGSTYSEIRAFDLDTEDDDVWQPEGEIKFCDFPEIRVVEHRLKAPSYWDKASSKYYSYMVHGWDCCTKSIRG